MADENYTGAIASEKTEDLKTKKKPIKKTDEVEE